MLLKQWTEHISGFEAGACGGVYGSAQTRRIGICEVEVLRIVLHMYFSFHIKINRLGVI